MSEYIKQSDAVTAIHQSAMNHKGITMEIAKTYDLARKAVESIPAADVEPVVRGELRINDQGFLECSACGKTLRMPLTSTYEMKRCYICGAHLERSGSGE